MDFKVKLLKEFYCGLPKDKAKVETHNYGFEFLDKMLAGGLNLEYGELTLTGLLHKYKLVNIPEKMMDELLLSHTNKECNVCLYFNEAKNNVFCFNLDNNHKTNNTLIIPEMNLAVRALRGHLSELGCEPLIIASGRGYHVWCRLDSEVDNNLLYSFMLRLAAMTMVKIHENGYDYNKVKFNFYPDIRINNVVSLRLFGSEHAKNRTFSYIYTLNGLLNEAVSWTYFEEYMKCKTISKKKFTDAYETIMA